MTVGKADDTCFNALNPRNAVSPQRTAHRNGVAPHEELPRMVSRQSRNCRRQSRLPQWRC
ncbi:hypothetical protein LC593_17300 [Nostoc sp. CHAB 5844]|nr:hypothetical protein [Nostoc sp. CHAB 5844]